MPRMYKPEGGYHNFNIAEVDAAKADGWKIVTDDEWNKILADKRKTVALESETVTIEKRSKAGRPKGNSLPAFLGGSDGDSADNN